MITPFHTCTLLWSYSGHSFIFTARPILDYGRIVVILIVTAGPVPYYGRTVVILSSLQHDLLQTDHDSGANGG